MPNTLTQIIHGTVMVVHHTGVLILGGSGSGKSEIAFHLISRGHSLVSDDAVLLQVYNNKLIASPPDEICQHLHLRDIGIISPNNHCSHETNSSSAEVRLIIHLTNQIIPKAITLELQLEKTMYLGIEVPLCHLTTQSYCPPALKLETLVKQFTLLRTTAGETRPNHKEKI